MGPTSINSTRLQGSTRTYKQTPYHLPSNDFLPRVKVAKTGFLAGTNELLLTRLQDNLLGICDARLPIDKLQQLFHMVYDLELQVEQEGDSTGSLSAIA